MNNNLQFYGGGLDLPYEIAAEKKNVSRILLALTFAALLSYVTLIAVSIFISLFFPYIAGIGMVQLLISDLYTVLAIVLFLAFAHRSPNQKVIPVEKMTFVKFMILLVSSVSLMVTGAFIGNAISAAVGSLIGRDVENAVETVIDSYNIFEITVSVVIIAPITEEFLFRKLIIDKTIRYGTSFSIVFSGLVFGAFHGNFYQFFYAATLGMLLAYIYCVYGKLRYTILLHTIINFMGSVVSIYVSEFMESSGIIQKTIAAFYSMSYTACLPLGVIFIIKGFRKYKYYKVGGVLISPSKTLDGNAGFIVYIIYTLLLFAYNMFV